MKVFEEIEIGQQVTQVTEQNGTWSNIDYSGYSYSFEYAALPVNPLNIFGITDYLSNASFPTLTVIQGQPKVTY